MSTIHRFPFELEALMTMDQLQNAVLVKVTITSLRLWPLFINLYVRWNWRLSKIVVQTPWAQISLFLSMFSFWILYLCCIHDVDVQLGFLWVMHLPVAVHWERMCNTYATHYSQDLSKEEKEGWGDGLVLGYYVMM